MDSTTEQAEPSFWESLRRGFAKLREECAINPPLVPAGQLSAIWESQPEPGSWRLNYRSGNDGLGVAQRFRWHAASGAARLGFQGDPDAGLAYWLDKLKIDAPNAHLRRLKGGGSLGFIEILDVCGLSSDYCRKCDAAETAHRHNWLESLSKDDPNYDGATRFELTAWRDSWGLVADGLGGRLSLEDYVEGCANTFSQAAEAHVAFKDDAPISERCTELDRNADLFIEQYSNALRSASDRIGHTEVEEAAHTLTRRVHEIVARSKQRIYQAAAAQKAERTQELQVDTVAQAQPKGNSSEPAVPANRIQRYFRKVGETWSVSFDGKTVTIAHRLGMTYIGELLRSPRRSLDCLAFAGVSTPKSRQPGAAGGRP